MSATDFNSTAYAWVPHTRTKAEICERTQTATNILALLAEIVPSVDDRRATKQMIDMSGTFRETTNSLCISISQQFTSERERPSTYFSHNSWTMTDQFESFQNFTEESLSDARLVQYILTGDKFYDNIVLVVAFQFVIYFVKDSLACLVFIEPRKCIAVTDKHCCCRTLTTFWLAVPDTWRILNSCDSGSKRTGKNFPPIFLETDPNMEYLPQRLIYDHAWIEPGTSRTGILAEAFWEPPH